MSGDIEIAPDGDFVRIIKNRAGKFIKKEGMYSPIAQNERHVRILREILVKEKLIKTFPVKSLVVLANPRTMDDLKRVRGFGDWKAQKYGDSILGIIADQIP